MAVKYVLEKLGAPEPYDTGIAKGLTEAASKNPKIAIVMNDYGSPAYAWFAKNAPNRMFELGISEGNGAVFSAGLAFEGYKVFWSPMGFAGVGRAYNQIWQSICVDRMDVKMLCSWMSAISYLGISHNCIFDLAAMRVLPNMVIVSPADVVEAEKAVKAIADYNGPVYFRTERVPSPARIYADDYQFKLGKASLVREGCDATIIAQGYMVTESLLAADLLAKENIDVQVINMSTIKPLDEEALLEAAEKTGAIVTAENHSIIGGLGEAVATVLSENYHVPTYRIGVRDEFSQSGVITKDGKDELKIHLNLTAEDISKAVKKVMRKK